MLPEPKRGLAVRPLQLAFRVYPQRVAPNLVEGIEVARQVVVTPELRDEHLERGDDIGRCAVRVLVRLPAVELHRRFERPRLALVEDVAGVDHPGARTRVRQADPSALGRDQLDVEPAMAEADQVRTGQQ